MTRESPNEVLREALYNSRATGPAWQIQMPSESVTRVHGLMVDLDADLLRPNTWFPPADTAERFYAGIMPVLERHPIMRYAEIRNTGRWLHALVWFRDPIELRSAADQKRWIGLHQVLIASVPSDAAAPALIGLTRPVGSVNSKTGGTVSTLKQGEAITSALFEGWVSDVHAKPFEQLGLPVFGERRVTPCPYCGKAGSHLDIGDVVGFCYGPCIKVKVNQIFEPFLKEFSRKGETTKSAKRQRTATTLSSESTAADTPVITIDRDVVIQIDPDQVRNITIRVGKP